MNRLDQALRIGVLGTSLTNLGDMAKEFTSVPQARPLTVNLNGSTRTFTVPAHMAEEVLAVVGRLLSDHLNAEMNDAAEVVAETSTPEIERRPGASPFKPGVS